MRNLQNVILLAMLFIALNIHAQSDCSNPYVDRSSQFDSLLIDRDLRIYDGSGTEYLANEISYTDDTTVGSPFFFVLPASNTCTAGLFTIHFSSDPSGTSNYGFFNSTSGAARKDVVCQVFRDLSVLLADVNPSNAGRVHIWVGSEKAYIASVPATSFTNIAAMANQFFVLPNGMNNAILDGEVYKTLRSGYDSYTNLPLGFRPFNSQGLYHGFLAVNFNTPFFLNYGSTAIGSGEKDMYSVVLHEAIHMLGFNSNIAANGSSRFSVGGNIDVYFRFDKLLARNSAANRIITYAGTNDWQYSGINPVGQGCASPNNILFSGNNLTGQAVYNPTSWTYAANLSHFGCAATACDASFNAPTSNFAMNPYCATATGAASIKRRPNASEVKALCDLGYTLRVNGSTIAYGDNTGNTSIYQTYSSCSSVCHAAGVADFLTTGYNTPITTPFSTLLANDANGSGGTIPQMFLVTTAAGSLTTTSTGFTFAPTSTFSGIAVLAYYPRCNGSSENGNLTYIFITVIAPVLPPCRNNYECNLICNGDLEYGNQVALYADLNTTIADINTPDLFVRSSTPGQICYLSNPSNIPISCNSPGAGCGQVTGAPMTWPPNGGNHFIGMVGTNWNRESIHLRLRKTLVPGKNYQLSFWGRAGGTACVPVNLEVRGDDQAPCPIAEKTLFTGTSTCGFTASFLGQSASMTPTWTKHTININPTQNITDLVLSVNEANPNASYGYFDDFELVELNVPLAQITASPTSFSPCINTTQAVTYTICMPAGTIGNNTVPVKLKLNLPAGFTVGAGSSFSASGDFTIPVNTISASTCTTLTLNLQLGIGIIPNTVYEIPLDIDGCLTNSTNVITVNPVSLPLTITKSVSNTTPATTELLTYTIEVCNFGLGAVNGISLTDVLPAGLIPQDLNGFTLTGSTLSRTVNMPAAVSAGTPSCQSYTFTARLESCTLAGTTLNNCASASMPGNSCLPIQSCIAVNVQAPNLTALPATVCSGGSTILKITGGQSYAWSNSAGNVATQTVSPASTTTYTATITNSPCATVVKSVTVTVDQSCCAAANASLSATQNAQLTFGNITSSQLVAQIAAVNSGYISGTQPNTLQLGSIHIVINGTLSMDADLNFLACSDVRFGANGQILTNNFKLSSYLSVFRSCGPQMWQGINVNHANGEVYFKDFWFGRNKIIDAVIGIAGNNGGKITAQYTDFESCLRGISVSNTKPAVFDVYSCNFGTPTPLKSYTVNTTNPSITMTYKGIEIKDLNNSAANPVTIGYGPTGGGSTTGWQNRFTMTTNDNGDVLNPVYIRNSYVNVVNNYFKITRNQFTSVASANIGVHVMYSATGNPSLIVPTVNIGNRTVESENTFVNGDWAVYTNNNANLNVNRNTFQGQVKNAIVSANNTNGNVLLRGNSITSQNAYTAILIDNANTVVTNIDSNTIGTGTSVFPAIDNCGIRVNTYTQPTTNTTTNLYIRDNKIYDLCKGISLNSVRFCEVSNNAIYLNGFTSPPANFTWYGIEAVNSTYPYIVQNTVAVASTATAPAYAANNSLTNKVLGIHINTLQAFNGQNYAAWISCNQVQGMHWGVGATGSNPSGFFLRQNQMSANKAAFTIYNNGNIGQQGTSTWANDNRWINLTTTNGEFHFGYYNTSTSTTPANWYVRNAASGGNAELNPTLFPGGVKESKSSPLPLSFPLGSIAASNSIVACAPFRNLRSGKTEEYGELLARLEGQIADTFNYSELPVHYNLWKEEQVLDVLMSNTELLEESEALTDFYSKPQYTSYIALMDLFRKAEGTDDATLLGELATEAATIVPGNAHETNIQTLMVLMAKAATLPNKWQDMSGADSILLHGIADKCFVTDGQSVLYARSFWNSKVGFEDRQFQDYCLATTGYYKKDNAGEQELTARLQVYPTRLQQGQALTIISPASGMMEVYTIDGKKAGTYSIQEGGQTLNQFDLMASQMLLLRFRLSDGSLTFRKIILYR